MSVSLVYTALLLPFATFILWYVLNRWNGKLPPGPLPLPFVGHLHLLAKGEAPNVLFTKLARRYGPLVSLQLGTVPVVIASSSKAVKELIKNHDLAIASRPPSAVGRILFDNHSNVALAPYGTRWRQLRRICTMELFNQRIIASFRSVRMHEIKSLLQLLLKKSDTLTDMRTALRNAAFNHTCQILMGKRYYGEENSKEAKEFIEAIEEFFKLLGAFAVGDFLPVLRWMDIGNIEKRLKALSDGMDVYVGRVIREHENRQQNAEPSDFVDVLLKLRDAGEDVLQGKTIKLLLFELFAAGADSTSVTLEWILSELVKHPEVMSKLQGEIEKAVGRDRLVEEDDIPNLHYLRAVIKENFRLHPPGPLLLPHYSLEPCTVMGYKIKQGTVLFFNVYAIGRDPSIWEDPLEFKPERMLSSKVDYRGQDFELLPFGSGRRICPGLPVAIQFIDIVLANLVHAFNWKAPPDRPVDTVTENYGLSVQMANQLQAIPSPRLAPEL